MTLPSVLTVTHYGPGRAGAVRQQLLDVYGEVYAAEAASDPFFAVDRFAERLDGHAAGEGWACVIGRVGAEVVGYAYGRPDSEREWRELDTVVGPEVREYGAGGGVFGLCEIMVRAPWRGTGVARVIHDELMSGRPQPRASLLVERTHPKVRQTYERWGYAAVGTVKPFDDSPLYDAMVLDLGHPSSRRTDV